MSFTKRLVVVLFLKEGPTTYITISSTASTRHSMTLKVMHCLSNLGGEHKTRGGMLQVREKG